MYRKPHVNQLAFEDCALPFGGKLHSDYCWVILAEQIPRAVVDTVYAQQFPKEEMGSPAKPSRLALSALLLKERLGVTDRELVEQIAENPSLQYFLGLLAYQDEPPFHHSLLTSEAMIQVSFLVMNLERLLTRGVFSWLVSWWHWMDVLMESPGGGPREHDACGFP